MSVVNTVTIPEGYLMIAKDRHAVTTCAVDKHGTRIGSTDADDAPPAPFVDRTTHGRLLQLRANAVFPLQRQYPDHDRVSLGWTTGLVGPNVARVVLTWPDGYHRSAPTRGGTYAVSLGKMPASDFPYAPQIAGYDHNGRPVARWKP